MLQTTAEVMEWIYNRGKSKRTKPGLERMEYVLERLDFPQKKIHSIHIGGTNGKGSTTNFLRNILQEAGYTVGTYTSPYFERFEDRICINGKPIAQQDLIAIANKMKPFVNELETHSLGSPTPFEIITMIGFYFFAYIHPVDIVLVEVGLGGRYDATNVVEPFLSIITNIGHDHVHILGSTLTDIAYEKAGIIKENTPVLTAVSDPEAKAVLLDEGKKIGAPVYILGETFSYTDLGPSEKGEVFSFATTSHIFNHLELSMLGKHQIENASLAIMAALLLREKTHWLIDDAAISRGLEKARWPGRFEILSNDPHIIIDGAHNKEGLETLVSTLERHFPERRGTILFSCLQDKPLEQMIQILDSLPDDLVFTQFDFFRVEKAEKLYSLSQKKNKEIVTDWKKYLQKKISRMEKEEVLVITGSLYFISLVKPIIHNIL